MIRKIRNITLQMLAGANAVTVVTMLLIGYSDRINPQEHSLLANVGLAFPVFLAINVGFMLFFLVFRRKYALVSLAGLVAGYSPIRTYCPLNIRHDVPSGAVKVLSYNVHGFVADNPPEDSPNPILDYIIGSDADIVCLQEARLTDAIIEAAAKAYPFCDSVIHPGRGDCLVLMSKYPILSKDRIEYKSGSNLSAAFEVLMGRDTVTVVNNHFESTGISLADRAGFKEMVKGNSSRDTIKAESKRLAKSLGKSVRIRAPQVEAVAEYVRNKGGSIILCGDFNDSPISYAHRTLADVLTDCYVASGNGPGISYHYNAIYVRIDNIMCSGDWQPYRCKVDQSISYSDHYPIYCWLERLDEAKNKR